MLEINTIHCGNAYELIKEIPDKTVDLILTDPPYIMEATGGGIGGKRNYLKDIKNNNLDSNFDLNILEEFKRVCKQPNFIIFSSKAQILQYIQFAIANGYNWQLLTWHKTNPTPLTNNNYLPDTEYIFHIWKERKLGGSYETKAKYYITQVEKSGYDHPTVKPLRIIENLILNGSEKGDLVLDPFLGSGTTARACINLKRNYIGIEIKPDYCFIAQDRIKQQNLF